VGETRGHAESAVGISESLPVAAEGGHALSQPAHVAPFGRFAAATNLGSGPAESVQDVVTSYLEARKHRPKLSPMLLGVAALVLTVVGGALFFYLGPFSSDVNAPVTAAPAFSPTAAHNLAPVSATTGANTAAPPAAVAAAAVPVRAPEPAPERVSKATVKAPPPAAPVQEAAQPTAPVHVKAAVKVPDMFGALNAHPVSPRRSSDVAGGESAPSIDAMSTSGPLKALASSTAPPSPISEMSAPEHTGGQLKPPRLVTSVLPVYPQIAQVAGVEGDVVVQASLDKDGNVSSTKVLYGPMMLRQAAVDALRRWKYEPAQLDGKPVGTEMTVRIRFHR
jgi:protein TonB